MRALIKRQDENRIQREFLDIKKKHEKRLRLKLARSALSPSAMRGTLQKGAKGKLAPFLAKITFQKLQHCRNDKQFKNWFERNRKRIANAIKNQKLYNEKGWHESYAYAHAPKYLALYLRDLLAHSWNHEIDLEEYKRLEYLLYVPIDSRVIAAMKKMKYESFSEVNGMRELTERDLFYAAQDWIIKRTEKVGIPRIWFDDVFIVAT